MDLYLVRHAIAGNADPELWPDDDLRPLTKRGLRRFRRAARGLARLVPDVDLVLSSPKTRAWETAQVLQEDAGWPAPVRWDALGKISLDEVVPVVRSRAGLAAIALVGHEPDLSRLATALLGLGPGSAIELKKGAVACLTLEEPPEEAPDTADAVETGAAATDAAPAAPAPLARLRWLLPPRVLRQLAR